MSAVAARAPVPAVSRARAALFAYFAVMGTGIGFWAAHVPAVQQRTDIDAGTMGIVLFLIAAGAVCATPAISWMVRRQGARRWTTLGAVAFAMALMLPVLAATPALLMAGAFCLGLAIGATDVPLNVHAVEIEKAWNRPTMSAFHGFYSLGGAAGATAGGLAVAVGTWVPVAAVSLTLAGTALVAGRFLVRNDLHVDAGRPPWRLNAPAMVLGLLAALCFGIEGAVVDWSALYLSEAKSMPLSTAASGPAVFMLAMALARFCGDVVVERLGRPATLALSGTGIAAGLGIAVLAPDGVGAAFGFGLAGAAAANIVPILFSEAGRAQGIAPEAAIAAVSVIGYAGFLLSPPLVGAVAEMSSLSVAFALVGTSAMLFVAAGLRQLRQPRQTPPQSVWTSRR